jgi:RHS repeat-associated protein
MTPAGITHYIQDLQGRLIAEATDTDTIPREYVWVDDMPVAVFADLDTGSPQLYYVHPDHLNRPLRMTNGAKAVVWDATYKPFGEVHSITGSASLNLRFPGQYFLLEHGLAYNWHRYYDPTIGRYTRPDPIADYRLTAVQRDAMDPVSASAVPLPFQDGPSVYAYAKSAPTQYIDPDGRNAGAAVIGGAVWLCLKYPALCRATAKAVVDACIATYRVLVEGGGRKGKNYCKKVRAKCIDYCSDVALPGGDGFDFYNCVNICLQKHGCPSVRG